MNGLVVLSHLNSARTLKRCLDSLINQDCDNYKVIVIDAGSVDGSIEIANSYQTKVFCFVIPGISESKGQNLGISLANHEDVILFTNSDCHVPNNWVSKHLKWHERGYDIVGGKLFWGGDEYGFAWSYWTPSLPTNMLTSGLSLGFSNCSVSSKLFETIGPLKELKSQQDMEFWIRATKVSAKLVLDPKIEVYHDHPMKSFKGSWMRSFHYGKNHVILLRNAFGRRKWPNYSTYPYSKNLFLEFPFIYGVRVWKQQRLIALQHGIQTNLLRFLFYRVFASRLPNLFGWLVAMTNPIGKATEIPLENAHRWGK